MAKARANLRHIGSHRLVGRAWLGALVLAGATASPLASAQPPKTSSPTAEALFERGKELVKEKNFAEACPKLEQSLRLDPGLGTMLWLADCWENAGRTASAWTQFEAAASSAAERSDDREKIARRRAAALAPRLHRLLVTVPVTLPPQATISRDGAPIPTDNLGVAVPIDPGTHHLTVTAPNHVTWSLDVVVDTPGTTTRVEIPALVREGGAASEAGASPSPAPPADPGASMRTVGLATGAVGLVTLGVGAFLGLRAKSTYDASNDGHCLPGNFCDAEGKDLRAEADGLATGATVAFAAGAAAVLVGGAFYLLAPRKSAVALAPTATPNGGGFMLGGRF